MNLFLAVYALLPILVVAHLEYYELSFNSINLPDRDFKATSFVKGFTGRKDVSDPFLTLFLPNDKKQSEPGEIVLQTKHVENNLNPSWNEKLMVVYNPNIHQPFLLQISHFISKHECTNLGTASISLREIIEENKTGNKFTRALNAPNGVLSRVIQKTSTIEIKANQMDADQEYLHIKIDGRNLANKNKTKSASDPYFQIFLSDRKGQFEDPVYYTSEWLELKANPDWKTLRFSIAALTNSIQIENPINLARQILIMVWDWDDTGKQFHKDRFIGEFVTDVRALLNAAVDPNKPVVHALHNTKSKVHNGTLEVKVYRTISFMSMIAKKEQNINVVTAIDFTMSNGQYCKPNSLHYYIPNAPIPTENYYTVAIRSVGGIIGAIDADQLFPIFGFGGDVPIGARQVLDPSGLWRTEYDYDKVCHAFNLNGPGLLGMSLPCTSVDDMLASYRNAIQKVRLSTPTHLAEVIRATLKHIVDNGLNYYVLLIITDGAILDMDETKNAIRDACNYPLSILIVGVGEEQLGEKHGRNFSSMRELDGDINPFAPRDIVQFFKLEDVIANIHAIDATASVQGVYTAHITQKAYEELPGQGRGFLEMRCRQLYKY